MTSHRTTSSLATSSTKLTNQTPFIIATLTPSTAPGEDRPPLPPFPAGKRAAVLALRWALGLFFLAAGLSKVGAPLPTLAAVYSYQIVLPDALALAIAHALPWAEIILGLALLSGIFLPLTLSVTAALILAFTALTAQAWWRELPIDCGCLDLSGLHPSLAVLATPGGATLRNIFLLGLTALLAWLVRSPAGQE